MTISKPYPYRHDFKAALVSQTSTAGCKRLDCRHYRTDQRRCPPHSATKSVGYTVQRYFFVHSDLNPNQIIHRFGLLEEIHYWVRLPANFVSRFELHDWQAPYEMVYHIHWLDDLPVDYWEKIAKRLNRYLKMSHITMNTNVLEAGDFILILKFSATYRALYYLSAIHKDTVMCVV